MDFSPWDIADSFRLHEAACLIAGVMPLSKRFPDADEIPAAAKPVLKKLSVGYYFGTMLDASEAIDSPQNPKEKWLFGIAADPSDVNLVWKHPRGAIRKGGTTLDMGATILSYLKHAMVSRSELHRWVKAMGIKSAYSFAPIVASHSAEPDTAPAQTTAPVVTANAGKVPLTTAPAWCLNKPTRFQGYGKPLYDFLKAAHIAGQTKPNARDLLDSWKSKPPLDVVEVNDNSLKYYDAKGNTKPADLEAIRKTINRMTR